MNILCTICARKGSKGIKGKNLLKIKNKSLIFYTIDQAQKIKSINDIVISTDLKLSPKELKKRRQPLSKKCGLGLCLRLRKKRWRDSKWPEQVSQRILIFP